MSDDFIKRLRAADELLSEKTTSLQKFESVRKMVKGINKDLDEKLEKTSRALKDFDKVKKDKWIELGAEKLPENTKEQKKKKKALLLLIRRWKSLRSEVKRVSKEFEAMRESELKVEKANNVRKLVTQAKGPLGLITLVAVGLVVVNVLTGKDGKEIEPIVVGGEVETIEVIRVGDKLVPLSEVTEAKGAECEGEEHYHGVYHEGVRALDGTLIEDPDPYGCGFGLVDSVEVEVVGIE